MVDLNGEGCRPSRLDVSSSSLRILLPEFPQMSQLLIQLWLLDTALVTEVQFSEMHLYMYFRSGDTDL